MSNEPERIIVIESSCGMCSVHEFRVHHQTFPEMQVEGASADAAVEFLAERLATDLDCIADPSRREAVRDAINDARAFLERRAAGLLAPDLIAPSAR